MSDMSPTAIANQSLDAAGITFTLGDIEEGTRSAQVCLRAYRHCLQQLLRAAHWNFARKQAQMELLADASGQTPNVGTIVPAPWTYEYAYPPDCMKAPVPEVPTHSLAAVTRPLPLRLYVPLSPGLLPR